MSYTLNLFFIDKDILLCKYSACYVMIMNSLQVWMYVQLTFSTVQLFSSSIHLFVWRPEIFVF